MDREELFDWAKRIAPPVGTALVAGVASSVFPLPPGITGGAAALALSGAIFAGALGQWRVAQHLGGAAIGLGVGTGVSIARLNAHRAELLAGWPVTAGGAIVLWGTLETRLRDLGAIIERAQPQVIIVHGNNGLTQEWAARVRALAPNARYWTEQWVQGPGGVNAALEQALRAQQILGAEAAVWNAEAPFKNTGAAGRDAAQRLIQRWSEETGLKQGFTAYAQPTMHSSFPWAGFAGGRDETGSYALSCDFSLPQVYPFGDEMRGGSMAREGALLANMQAFRDRWQQGVDRGWIRASCEAAPMIPGAYIHDADYDAALGLSGSMPLPPCAAFWPQHGVIDEHGAAALERFCARWRTVLG